MSVSSNNPSDADDHRSSWSSLRQHIFGRAAAREPQPEAGEAEPPQGAPELDSLAKVNEEIRERCIQIVNRSDDLIALRNEFVDVFVGLDKILKETEGTSSALAERTAVLAREVEEHAALKSLHHALRDDNERKQAEIDLLRSEVERVNDLVAGREARINALEAELSTEKDTAAALRGEAEHERYVAALAAEKLQAALTEQASSEALIGDLQAQVAELSDRSSTAEFHVKAMQASLSEAQTAGKGLRDALAESQQKADAHGQALAATQTQLAAMRERRDELDSSLSSSRLEFELAQTLWQQRIEAGTEEIESLKAEIDVHRSRADAGEVQLSETRADLQTAAADSRARQRQVEQLEAKLASLDDFAKDAAQQNADLNHRLLESERSGASLADRSQALIRAMNDQRAKLDSAEHRAQLLEERLAAQSARYAAESEQYQQKIRSLVEKVEEEKVARIVISGALQAARGRTNKLRAESSLLDVLARAVNEAGDRQAGGAARANPAAEGAQPPPMEGPPAPPAAEVAGAPPAEPTDDPRSAMPRARPLVIRRDWQHGGGGGSRP
jgi:chromosome segregation ATPase